MRHVFVRNVQVGSVPNGGLSRKQRCRKQIAAPQWRMSALLYTGQDILKEILPRGRGNAYGNLCRGGQPKANPAWSGQQRRMSKKIIGKRLQQTLFGDFLSRMDYDSAYKTATRAREILLAQRLISCYTG